MLHLRYPRYALHCIMKFLSFSIQSVHSESLDACRFSSTDVLSIALLGGVAINSIIQEKHENQFFGIFNALKARDSLGCSTGF